MALNADDLLALQLKLRDVESLDLPFVYFDEHLVPIYISSRAASIFNIRQRQLLTDYETNLEPLAHLVQSAAAHAPAPAASAIGGEALGLAEIVLQTVEGRHFNAFAFAKPFALPLVEGASGPLAGFLCVFHDLTLFEPFFQTISQSRRNRAIIVLASSVLGRPLALHTHCPDITTAYCEAESNFFRRDATVSDKLGQTDLLDGLSTAVEIVDPLITSTAKILLQTKTPALLEISTPDFLRVVSHLLLEATDFSGPYGTTFVNATIKDSALHAHSRLIGTYQTVELSVTAQRTVNVPLNATPLELYIYRRYMPLHYKITVADSHVAAENGQAVQSKEFYFGANSQHTKQVLSENLMIVSHIASTCGVTLCLRRPEPDVLTLVAQFKPVSR